MINLGSLKIEKNSITSQSKLNKQELEQTNKKKEKFLILVNPNLGHPRFLFIDENLTRIFFRTHLLFVSNIENPKKLVDTLKKRIELCPIIEYKWKLKYEWKI